MNLKLPLFASLTVLLGFLSVQAQTGPESWKRYTVPGHQFSVVFPTLPAMTFYPPSEHEPWRIEIGAYADGVIYIVRVYENVRAQRSLADFIAEQSAEYKTATAKEIVVSGLAGKEYSVRNRHQFFADRNCFYDFTVVNAAADHPGAEAFFSSIAFGPKQKGIAISDGPGTPYQADETEITLTGKDVTQKARLASKPEPQYTKEARDNQITGTVVLKVVFTSTGNVSNIRIVSGLPCGLTEQAIAAAKKIKFIPAVKDGHYVSMWIQLEYNFNLY